MGRRSAPAVRPGAHEGLHRVRGLHLLGFLAEGDPPVIYGARRVYARAANWRRTPWPCPAQGCAARRPDIKALSRVSFPLSHSRNHWEVTDGRWYVTDESPDFSRGLQGIRGESDERAGALGDRRR